MGTEMSALKFLFITILLAVDFLFSAEGQRINITAKAGQDSVTLPCGAEKEKEIIAVGWIRPDLDPDLVLLYRGSRVESGGQHPSFRNRVDLQDRQMKDGNASLILKNVKINDTGTYECRVYQGGGNRMRRAATEIISTIHLEVSPPGQRINKKAEAGQDVTLPCGAGKETQIVVVGWSRPGLDPDYVFLYRDGRFESDGQHPSFRNRVDLQDRQMKDGDASLVLKDVKIKDTGTYECRVYQGGGGLELISSIHLEVSSPPEQTITAEAGQDSVTLPCGAGKDKIHMLLLDWIKSGLNPDTVFYYRYGHFYPDHQHPSFRNRVDLQDRQMKDGDASLILKDVTIKDTGTYECKVQTESDSVPELISTIHLEVSPPPPGAQEGGAKDGGGSLGLTVGLPVSVLCVLVGVAAWICYRKPGCLQRNSQHLPVKQSEPV